jgi:hypothetical protein
VASVSEDEVFQAVRDLVAAGEYLDDDYAEAFAEPD